MLEGHVETWTRRINCNTCTLFSRQQMLRRFCILDLSKRYWAATWGNADIYRQEQRNIIRRILEAGHTTLKELRTGLQRKSWRFGNNYPLSCTSRPLSLIRQDQRFFLYSLKTDHCLLCLQSKSTVKMFYFAWLWYHLKKASKFGPWEAPLPLLNCDWSCIEIWHYLIN